LQKEKIKYLINLTINYFYKSILKINIKFKYLRLSLCYNYYYDYHQNIIIILMKKLFLL